jgi:E3 ubiquitin-protein ligase mind-bomb
MEESILKMHDKTTLKNMALDKGLTRRGFNGRNVSRMRKQDFIDFLIFKDHNSPLRRLNSNEGSTSSLEDEVLNMFQELIMDDSFQPIIHIMGALHGLENIHVFGSRAENPRTGPKKETSERTPSEEDESIPNFTIQELIKNDCSSDCECEVCKKNNDIIKDNLKVKTSLQDLETKNTCVVCQSNVRNTIFSPCNHLATCISCAKNPLLGKKCPLCRKVFDSTTRVFC